MCLFTFLKSIPDPVDPMGKIWIRVLVLKNPKTYPYYSQFYFPQFEKSKNFMFFDFKNNVSIRKMFTEVEVELTNDALKNSTGFFVNGCNSQQQYSHQNDSSSNELEA